MKILIISNMYPSKENPSYGIFVKNFVNELKKYFKIDLIVIKKREKNKFKKLLKYLIFYLKIIFKLLFNNYDLVYIHYPSHVSIPVYFISKIKRMKIILNFHGDDALKKNGILNNLFYNFLKKLVRKANLIVVPSKYFRNIVINNFNISLNKIYIYPSGGIDFTIFKPLNKGKCKEKFGFSSNDVVLGYVSSIMEEKGWKIFLDIVKKISEIKPNVKAIVAGYGKDEIRFLKYIKKHKLENDIKFLGKCSQNFLPYVYNAMDIFIFPTLLNESLGLVGLEAMACKVPVVASKLGGIRDYVIDGYNGFLCKPNNVDDFFKKVNILIDNSKILKTLSNNAYETAKKFDKNIVNEKLVKKLYEVISDENFRYSRWS